VVQESETTFFDAGIDKHTEIQTLHTETRDLDETQTKILAKGLGEKERDREGQSGCVRERKKE